MHDDMYDEYKVPDDWMSAAVDRYTLYFKKPEHEAPAREIYGWLKSHRRLIHRVGRSLDGIRWSLLLGGVHHSYMIDHKKRSLVYYG
jgi:hypothetical protein